jgi:hypothetical protein
MSDYLKEGSVCICDTGQSGTLTHLDGKEASVLLLNLEMWHGITNRLRLPQDQADLNACPLNVEREVPMKRVSRD